MSEQSPSNPSGQTPTNPTNIQEEVLFEGSPVWTGRLKAFALTWLVALLLVVVPIVLMINGIHVIWWITAICVLLAIVLVIAQTVYHRTLSYRITNYRIDFARGMITHRIDSLELWHAHDIFFRQSLLERLMGAGSIDVLSDDGTTPRLELKAIPGARTLFDRLKTCILSAKRQRGMIELDRGIQPT